MNYFITSYYYYFLTNGHLRFKMKYEVLTKHYVI